MGFPDIFIDTPLSSSVTCLGHYQSLVFPGVGGILLAPTKHFLHVCLCGSDGSTQHFFCIFRRNAGLGPQTFDRSFLCVVLGSVWTRIVVVPTCLAQISPGCFVHLQIRWVASSVKPLEIRWVVVSSVKSLRLSRDLSRTWDWLDTKGLENVPKTNSLPL